ncbi:MAG TPA: pirin family protein [Caldimonas sp.]|nr:pirin family protein [Caldimonas sp.]
MGTSAPAFPAAIETVVVPRTADLGDDFRVRRALPSAERRMVGPFVFFDQMGPAVLRPGGGLDVRPHPHIGLATVTYLFEGEILHRDSLGSVQPIRPGELNWMTAGRGIVHSERTPAELRAAGPRASGIQAWVALPRADEEMDPAFAHHDAQALPVVEERGMRARIIAGEVDGARAPVALRSHLFYVDVILEPGGRFRLPAKAVERAAYAVEGRIAVGTGADATVYDAGRLLVFAPRADIVLEARDGPARLMALGGEPLDGPRHVWWNFVSSSRERIEQAKAEWKNGRFAPVPGEHEFIPLPEEPGRPVTYP